MKRPDPVARLAFGTALSEQGVHRLLCRQKQVPADRDNSLESAQGPVRHVLAHGK